MNNCSEKEALQPGRIGLNLAAWPACWNNCSETFTCSSRRSCCVWTIVRAGSLEAAKKKSRKTKTCSFYFYN